MKEIECIEVKFIDRLNFTPFGFRSTLIYLMTATQLLLDRGYDGTHYEELIYCLENLNKCANEIGIELPLREDII